MKTLNQYITASNLRIWIKPSVLGAISIALFSLTGQVAANDRDLRATTIPASACELSNSVQADKVFLSQGSWVFRTGETGGVIFNCPLPLNAYTVSDNSNDNDMTHFRVYYRDTDATGIESTLTARLQRKSTSGTLFLGPQWNSNNVNIAVHTAASHSTVHELAFSGQYMIQVTMGRTNANQRPMFTGIDFGSTFIFPTDIILNP